MINFKRILVPLDGSPMAESALPLAMALAQKFESEIILLNVLCFLIPTVSTPYFHFPNWMIKNCDFARHEAESYLRTCQNELGQQGINARILLREILPAESIVDAAIAERVDLIVMATHGFGGLARLVIGSVADKVVRHSPCPVLLVRQDGVDPCQKDYKKSLAASPRHFGKLSGIKGPHPSRRQLLAGGYRMS